MLKQEKPVSQPAAIKYLKTAYQPNFKVIFVMV